MLPVPLQTVPQAPQFAASVERSTHIPPQLLRPDGHTHMPPLQINPVGQTVPQLPQLLASLCRVVQIPEQFVWPLEHTALQVPFEQT